ncbi:MAG TPA: glycosyltransferase family 39 protein [Persephonella sp.]|nr:glycosyltransferase family 39 protein [Hydrogenothermaceae bacterium]HIQ25503.1 glycosyltransferase family 39 protein [Persephonella sp.]
MFTKQEQYQYTLFIFFIVFIYFWNIWINDVWTPNEAFYAEAVREMFESGNFIDIYYNYEHRFNKPPLTYWLVALSCFFFGISEFAVRFPIVLTGLGSLYLTFLIAQQLFNDKKVALFSVFIFAFSLQFVPNTRYASPEVPLTFFFLLTLYLFLKWYRTNSFKYLMFSYVSLGLTVLTKGFPYIVVIGGIIILFLLIETGFNLKSFWQKFLQLKIWIGLPIVVIIGFWWYFYSYLKYGNLFWDIYYQETLGRAFEHKSGYSVKDLTYYLSILIWAFLPYSLTAYFIVIVFIKHIKNFSFLYSWIIIMLVIFSLAKGKLPTYIVQVFPALSILIAYSIIYYSPKKIKKYIYYLTFLIPILIVSLAIVFLVYMLNLDMFYYIFSGFPFLYLIRYKNIKLLPFVSIMLLFLVFVISVLPKIEKYRPYDKIGKAIEENFIPKSIPLVIENRFFYNLPFYTKRKVISQKTKEIINNKPYLVLVKENNLKFFENYAVLWKGKIFNGKSESQFARLLKAVILAEKYRNFSKFDNYVLVYKQR